MPKHTTVLLRAYPSVNTTKQHVNVLPVCYTFTRIVLRARADTEQRDTASERASASVAVLAQVECCKDLWALSRSALFRCLPTQLLICFTGVFAHFPDLAPAQDFIVQRCSRVIKGDRGCPDLSRH